MSQRIRDAFIAVGLETTPGTAAASNTMRVIPANITVPTLDVQKASREDAFSSFGLPGRGGILGSTSTIEIAVPIHVASALRTAAGDALSPPPTDALLKACGLVRSDTTDHLDATYRFAPLSDNTSVTIEWRAGTRRFKMVGCKGTFSIPIESNGEMLFQFSFQGRAEVVHTATTSMRPADAGEAYTRIRSFGANLGLGPYNGSISHPGTPVISASFELGAEITRSGDITAADSSTLPAIVSRRPTQVFNMVAPNLTGSSEDPFWSRVTGDELVTTTAEFGTAETGVVMTLRLRGLESTTGETSNLDGILGQQITFSLSGVDADPFELEFTTPVV